MSTQTREIQLTVEARRVRTLDMTEYHGRCDDRLLRALPPRAPLSLWARMTKELGRMTSELKYDGPRG